MQRSLGIGAGREPRPLGGLAQAVCILRHGTGSASTAPGRREVLPTQPACLRPSPVGFWATSCQGPATAGTPTHCAPAPFRWAGSFLLALPPPATVRSQNRLRQFFPATPPSPGQQTGLLTGPTQPCTQLQLGGGWGEFCELSREKTSFHKAEVRRGTLEESSGWPGPGAGQGQPGEGLGPSQDGGSSAQLAGVPPADSARLPHTWRFRTVTRSPGQPEAAAGWRRQGILSGTSV